MRQNIIKLICSIICVLLITSLVACGSVTESPAAKDGANGLSAYELAVQNGFEGTLNEWLASLKGKNGRDGKDATNKGDSVMDILKDKKIVYDGDSICEERYKGQAANGGAYSKQISTLTGCTYENFAVGGGTLASWGGKCHSVVDTLEKLPSDADIYCFEGGINDYWKNIPLGSFDPYDYTDELDIDTVCGALEYIFRYSIENFEGSICFVITHKISEYNMTTGECTGHTFTKKNSAPEPYNFAECYEKLIGICKKYSIPYYDAYNESGLNAWNDTVNNTYLTAGGACTAEQGDGCHPNEAAYKKFYVPQLIDLFQRILPK